MDHLFNFLQQSSQSNKIKKAIRHFYDALYLRTVRHDLDSKRLSNIYNIY
jgi:hypothetical protein